MQDKKAKTQIEKARKQLTVRRAYQNIFGSPEGKMVLHDLMREHDLLSVPRSLDHAQLSYEAGAQSVLKRIFVYLNTDIATLEERIKEYVQTVDE